VILQGWPIEYFQEGATVVKFHFTNWIGRHTSNFKIQGS